MNKRSLKLLGLTSLLFSLCSIPVLANKKDVIEVNAAQHAANFDEYDYKSYSGSYYSFLPSDPTEGLDGTLRTSLTSNILPKAWYTYSGKGTNTLSSILQQADEDPTNSSNMIYLYTRDSVAKNAASSWNREHTWPQSLSGGNWGEGRAGTDILHLRPTYSTPNSTRGNNKFAEISGGTKRTYNGMDFGYTSGSNFMPLDSVKGDVARIIMYVWVAYKSYYKSMPAITNVFDSYNTLLKWHTQDKPDVMEAHRNDVSENSLQKNRNPFVDHPEYAWQIFGASCSASVKEECKSAYPLGGGGGGQTTTKTLTGLTKSGSLNKTTYQVGSQFNPAGLTVTATYSDGSTANVTSNVTWVADTSSAGQKTVTGSYTYEGTTEYVYATITVVEQPSPSKTLVSVEVDGQCETVYKVGDEFDPHGLTFTAKFSDGSEEDVTDQISWTAYMSNVGESVAIWEYSYGTDLRSGEIEITINAVVPPIIDDDDNDDDPPVIDDDDDDDPPVIDDDDGDPPAPDHDDDDDKPNSIIDMLPGLGCLGSVTSTSIVIFITAILGICLVCLRKKNVDIKIKK